MLRRDTQRFSNAFKRAFQVQLRPCIKRNVGLSRVAEITRFAASRVRCGLLSRSTHAVLEPGSLVPACAAASAPLAVKISAT